MRCLLPITIKRSDADYVTRKQLGEEVTKFTKVPCGKCVNCLQNYINQWSFRLQVEADYYYERNQEVNFVTLTYADEHLPPNGVDKQEIVKFHKRLRKNYQLTDMKYILISEYGPHGQRPHYHAIYFGVPSISFEQIWKNGFVEVSPLLPERINYVCSYHVLKNFFVPEGQNPNFRLMSKGLGLDGFDKYLNNAHINDWNFVFDSNLFKVSLHRYYKENFAPYRPAKIGFYKSLPVETAKSYMDAVNLKTENFIKRKMFNKQF